VLRQAPKPCGRFRCCPARRSTIAKFADHLGFRVTYRQVRPNPYVALDRDGLELHYFGIPSFLPEDSYGSCVVRRPGRGTTARPEERREAEEYLAELRERLGD
jgi:hypothetical protein